MQTISDEKSVLFWSLVIYRWYIRKTSHGYDKSARYQCNLRDILSRYRSSETSLQQYIAKQTIYRCSEVCCNDLSLWTALQWFIVRKRLCTINQCLCTCNRHSRVISGWTQTKIILLPKSSPCFTLTSSFHWKVRLLVKFMWKMFLSFRKHCRGMVNMSY